MKAMSPCRRFAPCTTATVPCKDTHGGVRLPSPSAYDNRPLLFSEFEQRIHQTVYVSATPGPYESAKAEQVVEQIIRPTGLLDPKIIVRKATGQDDDLVGEIRQVTARNERVLVTTLTSAWRKA